MEKVASVAKAARRAIGASIVLSQWRTGGVAEQAALEDLTDYGITSILKATIPDRAAFRKMSFDGRAIVAGTLGLMVDKVVEELAKLAKLAQKGELA
jgi:hypothetical protein